MTFVEGKLAMSDNTLELVDASAVVGQQHF
jgi:hypothetical protein